MSIWHVSGKTSTALFSAHHPSSVQVNLDDGKGSRNATTKFQDANSSILESPKKQNLRCKKQHEHLPCLWKDTHCSVSAHHSSTVKMHLGNGRGFRGTRVEFLNTTSIIMKSSMTQYLQSQNKMSIWLAFGRISTALFSAHHPSLVEVHLDAV